MKPGWCPNTFQALTLFFRTPAEEHPLLARLVCNLDLGLSLSLPPGRLQQQRLRRESLGSRLSSLVEIYHHDLIRSVIIWAENCFRNRLNMLLTLADTATPSCPMLTNGNSNESSWKMLIETLACVMGFPFKVNEIGTSPFSAISNKTSQPIKSPRSAMASEIMIKSCRVSVKGNWNHEFVLRRNNIKSLLRVLRNNHRCYVLSITLKKKSGNF